MLWPSKPFTIFTQKVLPFWPPHIPFRPLPPASAWSLLSPTWPGWWASLHLPSLLLGVLLGFCLGPIVDLLWFIRWMDYQQAFAACARSLGLGTTGRWMSDLESVIRELRLFRLQVASQNQRISALAVGAAAGSPTRSELVGSLPAIRPASGSASLPPFGIFAC